MENMCIHVRFSPLMQKISKNNSKCSLEIVPLVTCIENIDKIKWNHKKDKIEYTVPMNYKIVIKKLKSNHDSIKVYYSCVDLLPSFLSNKDIDTVDVYRVISDNIVLNKEKTDLMAQMICNVAMPPLDIKLTKTMHHISKTTNPSENANESPMFLDLSDSLLTSVNTSEKLKSGSIKTEKDEATENKFSRGTENHTYIDRSTSTILQNYNIKTANHQKFTKNYRRRKIYITPVSENIHPINTINYYYSVLDNFRTNKKISVHKLDIILEKYDSTKTRIYRTLQPSPHHIIHDSVDEEKIISDIRIQPEVRIAKFVEKMENEIMPLKIILSNIVAKCSSLGLSKNILSNNFLLDANLILGSNQIIKRCVEREKIYNRVVYSVVFDE